jgi:hypothetical protein
MNEKLLQFIWQFQYFRNTSLQTTAGEEIVILQQGRLNKDQGPDFTDAKIKVGDTVFAGTVELHIKTSDWKKHRHELDDKYNNVILHVVFENDGEVNNIPVVELQPLIPSVLLERYSRLMHSPAFIPCDASIKEVTPIVWLSWKERLLVERLTRKSKMILSLLEETNSHWEETFWWLLARNFGMKVNSDAFEAIARTIPVNVLAKHKSQHIQLEALLFGQSNLLSPRYEEEYPKLLFREYVFLRKKYSLHPIHLPVLFLRMRPGNFPTIRLAQLAALIHVSDHLFSKILEEEKLEKVRKLFEVTANDYWHYHYHFDDPGSFKRKKLGKEMINNILINTVIPSVFSYGLYHKDEKYKDKALQWLEQLSAEANAIVKGFAGLNINASTAYDTQALIELKNEYCNYKKCLSCSVGNFLIKKEVAATASLTSI